MKGINDSYGPQIQDELPSSASVEDDLHKIRKLHFIMLFYYLYLCLCFWL